MSTNYRQRNTDKRWYKVVYGNFRAAAQAHDMVKKLPAAARKYAPWVRSFKSIRNEIEVDSSQLAHINLY